MTFISFLSSFRLLNAHSGLRLAGNFFLSPFQRIYKVLLVEATAWNTFKGWLVINQNKFTIQKRKEFLQNCKFHTSGSFFAHSPCIPTDLCNKDAYFCKYKLIKFLIYTYLRIISVRGHVQTVKQCCI